MTWQPIETAPRHEPIQLWRPDAHEWARCDIGKWDDDEYAKKPRPYWRSFLYNVVKSEMRSWYPTHWQPLPQPPTQPPTASTPCRCPAVRPSMPDPTPDRPPLWRVMHDAFLSSDLSGPHGHLIAQGFAREIRAVRDWFHRHSDLSMKPATFHQIYDLLTDEADRAERGDG